MDNGEIAIGILFFYQGFNKYQKKHVINLSSWYSKESHRAIEVLKFANNFTKLLHRKNVNLQVYESAHPNLFFEVFNQVNTPMRRVGFDLKLTPILDK